MIVALCAFAAAPVKAQPIAPDEEIARRHYARAVQLYDDGRYAEAIEEFERARTYAPRPELDYNVARCFDRLEQAPQAIAAYQRYLDAAGASPAQAAVRERIAVLRTRLVLPRRVDPLAVSLLTVGAAAVLSCSGLFAASAIHDAHAAEADTYQRFHDLAGAAQNEWIAGAVVASVGAALVLGGVARYVVTSRGRARPRATR